MARSIEQIEKVITDNLKGLSLSASKVAEWHLWVHCFAYVIYSFELIMDAFKKEMDKKAETMYTGSLAWYNEICYRFQFGHELVFNEDTAEISYKEQDENARIIKIASVSVIEQTLAFKIATQDENGKIIPLSEVQLLDFKNYLDVIKFAGTRTSVVSTEADSILYDINVYYEPSTPISDLEAALNESLESFKTEQTFGGVIYYHKFLDAIIRVPGVTTAKINSLKRKGSIDTEYIDIDTRSELYAGYFDYSKDCRITLINANEL